MTMSVTTKSSTSAGRASVVASDAARASGRQEYVVTGGNGFLGSKIVRLLKEDGFTVRVLCRSLPNVNEAVPGVSYEQGSVTSIEDVRRVCGLGVAGVFHLAGMVWHSNISAEQTRANRDINVTGLMNVLTVVKDLQQANGKKIRVVFASTSGVNACSLNRAFEADEKTPYATSVVGKWPYYASKIEAEMLSRDFAKKNDLEVVYMRPSLIIGPGDERLTSVKLIYDFVNETIPFTPPGGVSFVDVRDAAQAFVNGMLFPSVSDTYMLSSANCSIFDLFVHLEHISGIMRPPFVAPAFLTTGGAKLLTFLNGLVFRYDASVDPVFAEMGTHFWNCSSLRAQKELEFKPRDARKTVEDTVDWIRENKKFLQVTNSKPKNQFEAAKRSYRVVFLLLVLFLIMMALYNHRGEIAEGLKQVKSYSKRHLRL